MRPTAGQQSTWVWSPNGRRRVIGAGPNDLVAANLLADAGWDLLVLEAQPEPGGGVSSAGYLGDGWTRPKTLGASAGEKLGGEDSNPQ